MSTNREELCMHLFRQEGGTDGGIIVQDSLDMLHSLLANEQQVQVMFRCSLQAV